MKFLTPLINQDIDSRFARVFAAFGFESEVLKKLGYDGKGEVPAGFVHDGESVPVIKGTSFRGGVIHDYYCRKDSIPVLTKKQAADIYFEAMESRDVCYKKDSTEKKRIKESVPKRVEMWARRWIKYVVVIAAPGYFHKHTVTATYEEMSGVELQ